MKKTRLFIVLACFATLLAACKTNKEKETTEVTKSDQKQELVGADQDEHGCKGSAGYTWSEVRQECIRPFEAGIRLNNSQDSTATLSAFVVFATDSLKAELFIPNQQKGIVLDKDNQLWKDDTYSVYRKNGKLLVEEKGTQLFAE